MYKIKVINSFVVVISLGLLLNAPAVFAQKQVASNVHSAGFRFDAIATTSQPIILYQQNIELLSGIDDRPTFRVYGDGRVLVHFPPYMKKAGDYEMRLDDAELIELVRNLSVNGVLDFDEKTVKEKLRADENKLKARGQFHEISDAVETVVEVRLDEYQKNTTQKRVKNFTKQFHWKNLEQDAVRHKDKSEITRANKAVRTLDGLMHDQRLVNKRSQ